MKERLVIIHLNDFGRYGFARVADTEAEVYVDHHARVQYPSLYVGQTIYAHVLPPRPGKRNPIAKDISLEPPRPTPADYNPELSAEEQALWKLFVELKTQYHALRLARPLPALTEQMQSWAEELRQEGNR